jgi:hypothetical protein
VVVLVAAAESIIASLLYFEPVSSFELAHAITVEAYAAMAALRVEAFCRLVDRAIAANSAFTLHQEVQVRVAAIVTSSNDAIVGKTLDGVVMSWNEAEEDMILACLARGERIENSRRYVSPRMAATPSTRDGRTNHSRESAPPRFVRWRDICARD